MPDLTLEQRAEQILASIGYTTVFIHRQDEKGLAWRAEDVDKLKQAIATALRAVEAATWEAAIKAVQEACSVCNGVGYVIESYTESEHGCGGDERKCQEICPVPVEAQRQIQCEYCGRPIEALRRRAAHGGGA